VHPYASTISAPAPCNAPGLPGATIGETEWLEQALQQAVSLHQVDLSPWKASPGGNAVACFLQRHYRAVRCAMLHAKDSRGDLLLPGNLADSETVQRELGLIQGVVETLLRGRYATRLATSFMTPAGLTVFLDSYSSQVTLAVFEDTPETLNTAQTTPNPILLPVTYIGPSAGELEDWRFVTDVRCSDYSLRRIGCGVLNGPKVEGFFELQADKLRRSVVVRDLELAGIEKLEVVVRCTLRNPMAQRIGFSV
jgi:hypothetical protein